MTVKFSVTPGCINEGSVPALIKMPTGVAYSLVPNLNISILPNTKLTLSVKKLVNRNAEGYILLVNLCAFM